MNWTVGVEVVAWSTNVVRLESVRGLATSNLDKNISAREISYICLYVAFHAFWLTVFRKKGGR